MRIKYQAKIPYLNNQIDEAERSFRRALKFGEDFGIETIFFNKILTASFHGAEDRDVRAQRA